MKEKYGNSFGVSKESMKLCVSSPWIRVDEFYPGGAMLKTSDYIKQNTKPTVGQKIPLGTPIYMTGLGDRPYFNNTSEGGSTPDAAKAKLVGLTYEDAYVGEEGCSLTIVTRGTIHKENVEVDISKVSIPGITIV